MAFKSKIGSKVVAASLSLVGLLGCGPGRNYNMTHSLPPNAPGKAVAMMIDTSSSMDDRIHGERKIDIAKRSLEELLGKFSKYQGVSGGLQVGVYGFSGTVTEVVPMSNFDYERAVGRLTTLRTGGGTAIGYALASGERAVDTSRFYEKFVVLLTDGSNTSGSSPDEVMRDLVETNRLQGDSVTRVYVVGFDTNTRNFRSLSKSGVGVYSAFSKGDLDTIFSSIGEEILAEDPQSK